MNLDVLVFAAHPDDAEIGMGGTIAKFTKSGYKLGIVDLTLAELSTRGSIEKRKEEANIASQILDLTCRENLEIPDGGIADDQENLSKVVSTIRKYRPQLTFAPYFEDRHPDHVDTSRLVKRASFTSGLLKFKTMHDGKEQEPFRSNRLYYYTPTYDFKPSFIINISDYFEVKIQSIKAYDSQFFDPKSIEPKTFISEKSFLDYLEARARSFGFKIQCSYGEGFFSETPVEMELSTLMGDK